MRWRLVLIVTLAWIAFGFFHAPRGSAQAQTAQDLYKDVYNGWKWWHVYCYRCHGMNAVGGTLAPNLIDPNRKLTLKDFLFTVRNGSADGAMQAWNKLLDDKQITQLY